MGVFRLLKVVVLLAVASLLFAGQAAADSTGFLKICKVGLDEATLGQNFTFTFAGQTATVPAGTESGDFLSSCSQRFTLPTGTVAVTETVPAGFELVSIRTIPPGQATLAGNVATVTIAADAETTLVVRNRRVPEGQLKICKVGADTATIGRTFTFNVAGVGSFTVTAGGADPLSCTARIPVPAGTVTVTEVVPTGFQLVSCRTIPAGRVSLSGNVATVTIVAGEETALVCTNRATPGNVQLCKVAGTGVTAGTPFSFTVTIGTTAPRTVTIPAGQCVIFENIAAGTQVVITEAAAAGFTLQAIACDPASACTVDLANRRVVVTAQPGPGVSVEVRFTNIRTPGNLQLCKVAGTGVTAGTPFTFTVTIGTAAPRTVTVRAGQCVILENIAAGTRVVITEAAAAGTTLTAIACDPSSACTIELGARRVTVIVPPGPGVSVEVRFTNTKPPAVCTLTKGFFRNHPEVTAKIVASLGGTLRIGGTALTAAQVQAILDATPGQPGDVTFTSNELLNLTQQLIATLLTLGGTAGPAQVQAAIAAAQAGVKVTIGAGGAISISTTLSQTQISALIGTLSSFNEGAFPGFAHCDDS
jgi:hypothetical protein